MLQSFILKTINVYRVLEKEDQNYYKQQLGLSAEASVMEVEQALERLYKSNRHKAVEVAKEMDEEILDK